MDTETEINFFERARLRRVHLEQSRAQPLQEQAQDDRQGEGQGEGRRSQPMSALARLKALAERNAKEDPAPNLQLFAPDDDGAENQEEERQAQILEGTVSNVKVFGEWGLALLTQEDRQQWRISGEAVTALKSGLKYRVEGVPTRHPVHGEALEISMASPLLDAKPDDLSRYLVEHFDGIGRSAADGYIEALRRKDAGLLAQLSHVLVHEPWRLDISAVLSASPRIWAQQDTSVEHPVDDRQEQIYQQAKSAQKKAAIDSLSRYIMLNLGGPAALKDAQAKALALYYWERFGPDPDLLEKSLRSLRDDPYEPSLNVAGYGFEAADALGKRLDIGHEDVKRLRVAGSWLMRQACQRRGHAFLTAKEFATEVRRKMPETSAQTLLNVSAAFGSLVIDADQGHIYHPKLYRAQQSVAQQIAQRLAAGSEPMTHRSYDDVVAFLSEHAGKIHERYAKHGLDMSQIHAVASIMTSATSLHVLTGGPGTGKTTIMEFLVTMLRHRMHFVFAAPTGKAAKVLSSRLGVQASTICSLLRGTDESGYEVNELEPLVADVLVIDESTMVGIETADAILRAAHPHTHIIFLGDPGLLNKDGSPKQAGQLPSIAPGRFMHDLMCIDGVQKMHLDKVFRNGGGILEVVREVACGKLDVRDRGDSVIFKPLPAPKHAMQTVIARYLELARRDGMANTVLIMPRRTGPVNEPNWNVNWANAVLRDILNRDGIKMPGTSLRLGDRIIIRQNINLRVPTAQDIRGQSTTLDAARLAELAGIPSPQPMMLYSEDLPEKQVVRLVNGDTGFILGWRMDADDSRLGQPRWVELLLDDGLRVWLPGEEIASMEHAYALTVHAVQGSEYRNVLFCATDGNEGFMNANMLLTALSRAQSFLQVWGDERVLKRIAATGLPARHSDVCHAVQRYLEEMEQTAAEQPNSSVGAC